MGNVKVVKVLIASPSDVAEERDKASDVIYKWNTHLGDKFKVYLQPVKWETHATPGLGERPQALINTQIVEKADILIGFFWTRIGTDTGEAASGTIEEINEFRKKNKPVMLYFSGREAPVDSLDLDQLKKLRETKEYYLNEGIVFTYKSMSEFEELLYNHLTRKVEELFTKKNVGVINPHDFIHNLESVNKKLEELNKNKVWGELSTLLQKIKGKPEFKNSYNYFYARFIIYNPHVNISGPEVYLNSIDFESNFYIRGQKLLLFHYSKQFEDLHTKEFKTEMDKIAENILKKGEELPYYYFLKLKTLEDQDYNKCKKLYLDFKRKCRPLDFDFEKGVFKQMEVKSDHLILNLEYSFQIPTLNFYFLVHLLFKAYNSDKSDLSNEILEKVKKIYTLEKLRQKETQETVVLKSTPFQFEFRNFFQAEEEYHSIIRSLNKFDDSIFQ